MGEEKQDPMERIAAAMEAIADELDSIKWKIEAHSEAVSVAGLNISTSLDNVAAATRGEEKPEVNY